MAKSKQEIIGDIQSHITKRGGGMGGWYVGIAAKPEERLFDDHSGDKEKDAWIYCPASSSSVARDIEKHFLDKGADGGTGGWRRRFEVCLRVSDQFAHSGMTRT